MKNKNLKYFWFGVLAMLFGSINAPIIKHATQNISPATFNILRFALTTLLTLPFFIVNLPKLTRKNLRFAVVSGFCLALSTLSFAMAINASTASYIILLTLLEPIILVVLSVLLTKEKIKFRHLKNFSLAGFGALLIISAPIISVGNHNFSFYPFATFLALIMIISYPISIIFAKKSNEAPKKLPFISIIFIQAFIVSILSLIYAVASQSLNIDPIKQGNFSAILSIIYSGIFISIINRILNILNYQKIGSAINGALWYCGTLLSLIISIIFLDESLSIVALFGGSIILIAVALSKKTLTKKYYRQKSTR